MRTLGNILWHFPFLGFVTAILTLLMGLLITATVVAAPLGLGIIQLSNYYWAPFSQRLINSAALNGTQSANPAWQAWSTIVMILWLPFGLVLAAILVVQIALMFVTIIGIPVALAAAGSLGTIFNPVGKKCVPRAVAEELERRDAQKAIDKHLGPR